MLPHCLGFASKGRAALCLATLNLSRFVVRLCGGTVSVLLVVICAVACNRGSVRGVATWVYSYDRSAYGHGSLFTGEGCASETFQPDAFAERNSPVCALTGVGLHATVFGVFACC